MAAKVNIWPVMFGMLHMHCQCPPPVEPVLQIVSAESSGQVSTVSVIHLPHICCSLEREREECDNLSPK